MKALLLLSGGLDSSASFVLSVEPIALALTFDYGQEAAQREFTQAASLCNYFSVPHKTVGLPHFTDLPNQGALLSQGELPTLTKTELDDYESASRTADQVWIPNRNGVFIEVAAQMAESLGLSTVLVGFNREEAATFPDNSLEYLQAINSALSYSTRGRVRAHAPVGHMVKTEIVRKLRERDFPFSLLWSCYRNNEKMCGRCESCQRLKRALSQNEVKHDFFEDSILS